MDKPAVPHSRRVAMSDDARRPRSYASVAAAAQDPHAKAWERDASAIKVLEEKLAAAKLAYKHAPRTQRGRSGSTRREGRGRSTSRRPADATTTPGDGFAVVERRRRKSRAQRQESAGGLTGSVKSLAAENAVLKRQLAEVARPAADVTMTGETDAAAATGWNCTRCNAAHTHLKKKTCRLCELPREAPSAQAVATSTRSPGETAAAKATLQKEKESVAGFEGLSAARRAECIKDIEASLLRLDMLPAAVAAKSPTEALSEAQEAVDKAEAYATAVTEKAAGVQARIDALELDLDALALATTFAAQEIARSKAAFAEAHSLIGLLGPQRPVAAVSPPTADARFDTHRVMTTFWAFTHQKYLALMATLPEGESPVEEAAFLAQEFKVALEAGEAFCASPTAPPSPDLPTQISGSPVQGQTQTQMEAPGAAPTRAAPQPACHEGSRLASRPGTKAAATDVGASHTRMVLAAGAQATLVRKEARSAELEARREEAVAAAEVAVPGTLDG